MKILKHNRGASGFTVMELVVVIGLALLITGIALPNFLSWLPTLRLSNAARQVATDLQVARVKAISQNTKFRISFVGAIPGADSYELEKEDPNSPGNFIKESGPFDLPEGITVKAVGPHPHFLPRGTANTPSTITLENGNGDTKEINIALVGRVKI